MSCHKLGSAEKLSAGIGAAVVGLALVALLGGCGAKPAYEKPSSLFDIAKPGTVCVMAVYQAKISVPNTSFPQDKIAILGQRLREKVNAGELNPHDQSAVLEATVRELCDNILDYLVPTNERREFDRTVSMQGSGFFVTPDGYLVTNAHVVTANDDELKQGFAESVLTEIITKDVQDFDQALGGNVSKQMHQELIAAAQTWYVHYMDISTPQKTYLALPGVAVGGQDAAQKGLQATIVKIGEPIPGKDVAILKVEGKQFVTLPIGDDTTLKVGDRIYTLGYPGAATFHDYLKKTAPIQPNFTQGVISSRKQMSGGWDALQTDATITHGNSGGPALDTGGRVIGLTTWNAVEEETSASGETTAQNVQGENFLVPSTVVKEFLAQAGVTPQAGPLTVTWTQAMNKLAIDHDKSALALLTQVKNTAPDTPWIDDYIQTAQTGISSGKDRSWEEWLPGAIVVGIVIILGVVLAAVLISRNTRKAVAKAAPPGWGPPPSAPPAAPTYYPPIQASTAPPSAPPPASQAAPPPPPPPPAPPPPSG